MLEGTLESFSLPDIFQLLAFTKKTGCLGLDGDASDGRVYFREGEIYYALSGGGVLALGRRLVGAGLVGTEQLQKSLDDTGQDAGDGRGLRLGRLLVDQGAVDAATFEIYLREQMQDTVFDLMRWSDGSFRFDSDRDAVPAGETVALTVAVDELIKEGQRRLEEWEAVRRKIPSRSAVVAMASLADDSGVEVALTPEQWRLLTLVDGQRTVGDLVDIIGQGEFSTAKVLDAMVVAGLLQVREPGGDAPVATLVAQYELLRKLEGGATASRPRAVRPAPAVSTTDEDDDDSDAAPVAASGSAAPENVETPPEAVAPEAVAPETASSATVSSESGNDDAPASPGPGRAKVSTRGSNGSRPTQRLSTDPSIDEDLVQRLINGVKGL